MTKRSARRDLAAGRARPNFALKFVQIVAIGAIAVGLLWSTGKPGQAAYVAYMIMIDGRPLTDNLQNTGGLYRGGVFVDAVKLTKAFNGLVTFSNGGATLTITLAQRTTGTFTKGSQSAKIAGKTVALAGAPFIYNGSLYVPIGAFVALTGSKLSIDRGAKIAALTSPPRR